MGNLFSSCTAKKSSKNYENSRPISQFYIACRNGNIDQVQQLLRSITVNEINRIEPNGSTALHAACYYGHSEIVKILLDEGACRSIRNRKYSLTPYEESNEQIKTLFHRLNPNINRFTGTSVKQEWMMQTEQAAEWKTNLYSWLRIDKSFDEMIEFLLQHYLPKHVLPFCQSNRQKQSIDWFFRQVLVEQNITYIVKAYTSSTQFYSIVNNDLTKSLLRFFRQNYDGKYENTIEQSIGYLASIFIHHPDLRSFRYFGTAYRGLILTQQDLQTYTVGKRLLNKSFLSSSIDRKVAENFAGVDNSDALRRNTNHDLIQYTTICTYTITNHNTALNISSISEFPDEKEILIMPLCAFQVKSVTQLGDDSKIHVQIDLVECQRLIPLV